MGTAQTTTTNVVCLLQTTGRQRRVSCCCSWRTWPARPKPLLHVVPWVVQPLLLLLSMLLFMPSDWGLPTVLRCCWRCRCWCFCWCCWFCYWCSWRTSLVRLRISEYLVVGVFPLLLQLFLSSLSLFTRYLGSQVEDFAGRRAVRVLCHDTLILA